MSLLNGLGGIASATPPGPSSSLLNNSNGDWIVQKFGGTSVGKLPVNIAEDIVRYDDINTATLIFEVAMVH
jgi:aspartate kinase